MQYAWFIWSLILLVVWFAVYFSLRSKESKKEMLVVSFWTSLLGLTEPIFVPEYWSPPSLFDLAQKTGFDLESFIFTFGMGGLAVIIYEKILRVKHESVSVKERHQPRHKEHLFALLSAPLIFVLLSFFTDFNPIYSVFFALVGGGLFAWYCRPDLKKKMFISAFIFLAFYFLFFLILIAVYPDYVKQVWNLSAISGILILGIPLEELMFAFGLGFLWSSVYEHIKWRKIIKLTTYK